MIAYKCSETTIYSYFSDNKLLVLNHTSYCYINGGKMCGSELCLINLVNSSSFDANKLYIADGHNDTQCTSTPNQTVVVLPEANRNHCMLLNCHKNNFGRSSFGI